ncbi:MAG: Txe/YoeB family addiction module toxin [Bacteroidetes bacterium]|nr:Txe/YoeB family addiction module toxin [Candidatus Colenecus caballi]
MEYRIVFSSDAKKDLKLLQKKAPQALPKLVKLLDELKTHPKTGTGQVEPLKGYDGTVYSRRITHEHRLIYKIYDDVVEVLNLSAFGHYKVSASTGTY